MKERLIVWTVASLLPIAIIAGNIEAYSTGPSGQGDLVYKAKATGVTNLAMGTGGLYNVTFDSAYSVGDQKVDTLTVVEDATIGDSLTVNTNATVGGTLGVTGVATLSSNAAIAVNATVGGTLVVTGNITNSALTASKPVFTDANKALVSTGTLAVDQGGSGAATLTDHGVLVGSGTAAVTPLAVGTDGQLLVGASSADPAWATVGGAFTMAAGGTSTLIGNIAQARITNALVDAIGPAQMADADHGAVTWASGVATVDAVSAANLTAGTVASAIDGSAITNLTGTASPNGTVLNALDISACTNFNMANLGAGTTAAAFNGAAITALSAANITAGGVVSAVDGSAITNITAGNIAAGGVISAIDGSAITNLTAGNIAAGGTLPAVSGAALTSLSAANITAGGVISAIDGAAITNITAANVADVASGVNVTNSMLVADGAGSFTTNIVIMYPFGGGYMIKSITPVP